MEKEDRTTKINFGLISISAIFVKEGYKRPLFLTLVIGSHLITKHLPYMRHFLFLCSLLLIAIDIKASPILDSGTEKADSILSMVSLEISGVNIAKALELATEALSLSRDIGYSKGKAMSCFYIGQALSYFGDYQKSLKYLALSEQERYSRDNAIIQSEISRIKAQVYYMLNLDNTSLKEFMKAYEYTRRIKDKQKRDRFTSLAYENLSMAYTLIRENPDSSFYWMKKNEQLLSTIDDSLVFRNKINLYSYIGEHYTKRSQFDSATYYFEKAHSIIGQYNYPYSSWLFQRWGDLQQETGNSDSAMVLYRNGLNNLMATNIKNELPGFYQRIADIYSQRGDEDSARWYREKLQQMTAELGEAKNHATEEAIAMLLREERKMSQIKQQRIISLAVILFVIASLISGIIYRQLVIKRKKKESEILTLKQKLNDTFEEMIELARKNNTAFLPRFKEVYPEFTQNLLTQHPDLTNTELRLSALIFLNFASKEIADCMFITHRSVQTSKSRLRKKLGIPNETDLYQYFKSFT